jgi:hypothetical protein
MRRTVQDVMTRVTALAARAAARRGGRRDAGGVGHRRHRRPGPAVRAGPGRGGQGQPARLPRRLRHRLGAGRRGGAVRGQRPAARADHAGGRRRTPAGPPRRRPGPRPGGAPAPPGHGLDLEPGDLRPDRRRAPPDRAAGAAAGPTVVDMLADAAFHLGLALALAPDAGAWTRRLPFQQAHHNFYRAAQLGLGASLAWPLDPGWRVARCPSPSWSGGCCPPPGRACSRPASPATRSTGCWG